MFRATSPGTVLQGSPEAIYALSRSTNTASLQLGFGVAQPTRAWIVALRDRNPGLLFVYVYLGLVGERRGLLFASEPSIVPTERLASVLEAAVALCHSQGFTMETLSPGALSVAERQTIAAELPFELTTGGSGFRRAQITGGHQAIGTPVSEEFALSPSPATEGLQGLPPKQMTALQGAPEMTPQAAPGRAADMTALASLLRLF